MAVATRRRILKRAGREYRAGALGNTVPISVGARTDERSIFRETVIIAACMGVYVSLCVCVRKIVELSERSVYRSVEDSRRDIKSRKSKMQEGGGLGGKTCEARAGSPTDQKYFPAFVLIMYPAGTVSRVSPFPPSRQPVRNRIIYRNATLSEA